MKFILVPTDFSENANTAIEYACELGKSLGAKVLITHIYPPPSTIAHPLGKRESEHLQTTAEKKLKSIYDLIADQYSPLECETTFQVGGIVETIEKLIEENNIDLVVMGTRGATGLEKILFGSNTTKVIEKVKCPVLAIPRDAPFETPMRIVYATDFHTAELAHVQELTTIANAFKAEIMMTHITTDKEALLSEEMLKRNFSNRVSAITQYEPIKYFVKYEEDIARALESFTEQMNADWIALITHKRSLFEKLYNPSLTKEMAYHSKIPLLAIKG